MVREVSWPMSVDTPQLCRKGAGANVKTSKAWMTPVCISIVHNILFQLHFALSKGHADVAFELVKRGGLLFYV